MNEPNIDLTETHVRPGRLAVSVIGVGRVGAVLAAALASVGHRVVAVTGISEKSRERAAALVPQAPILEPADAVRLADLVLIAVPDDQLAGLVDGLVAVGAFGVGQLVAHTSGRYGLAVLQGASDQGALPMALHPVMTFTGTSLDLNRLADCVFGVSAPSALIPIADALVLEMGAEPIHVPDDARTLYHAALAHASNHLMALETSAMDLLRAAGVAEPGRLLGPLLTASLDNALRLGDRSLTGPVARGDVETVAAHLLAIDAVSSDTATVYRALARLTAQRALAVGLLDAAKAQRIVDVLDQTS